MLVLWTVLQRRRPIGYDHILPVCQGGKDEYNNLQLLHRHYHVTKTGLERATAQP